MKPLKYEDADDGVDDEEDEEGGDMASGFCDGSERERFAMDKLTGTWLLLWFVIGVIIDGDDVSLDEARFCGLADDGVLSGGVCASDVSGEVVTGVRWRPCDGLDVALRFESRPFVVGVLIRCVEAARSSCCC